MFPERAGAPVCRHGACRTHQVLASCDHRASLVQRRRFPTSERAVCQSRCAHRVRRKRGPRKRRPFFQGVQHPPAPVCEDGSASVPRAGCTASVCTGKKVQMKHSAAPRPSHWPDVRRSRSSAPALRVSALSSAALAPAARTARAEACCAAARGGRVLPRDATGARTRLRAAPAVGARRAARSLRPC